MSLPQDFSGGKPPSSDMRRAGALRVSHIWRSEVMADRVLPLPGTQSPDGWEFPFAIGGIVFSVLMLAAALYGIVLLKDAPPPGAEATSIEQDRYETRVTVAEHQPMYFAFGVLGILTLGFSVRYARKVSAGVADTSPVTVGSGPNAMFNTPDFDLPKDFAILRHGSRGHVLTLGQGMTGSVKLDGEEMSVADFLARGGGDRAEGSAGGFRATPIKPGDWGVIELDGIGDHNLFFHYVPPEAPVPRTSRWDTELLAPALAFSMVVHGAMLITAYQLHDGNQHSYVFPGTDDILNDYEIERPVELAEMSIDELKAGTEDGEQDAPPASTVGESGKSGGEGDKPRARAPDPDQGSAEAALIEKVRDTGLLRHTESLEKVAMRGGFDKRLGNAMARIQGPTNRGGLRGYGSGKGTGVGPGEGTGTTRGGDGKGPGGGGTAHGDVVTQGIIKTGGKRPARGVAGGKGLKEAKVKVKVGRASGDLGDLTAEQINKVVKSRKNAIRACYERQLQRNPNLSGKIVLRWTIVDGVVTKAKTKSTTMRNGAVEDCIIRQVMRMKFPKPKGGRKAIVNYPFIFAPR